MATKICPSCKSELDIEMFCINRNKPDGRNWQCRDCASLRQAQATTVTPEYSRNKQKKYRTATRKKLIDMLGGKCACCGETIFEFLTLDHINGNGRLDTKRWGRNIWGMYKAIIDAGAPPDQYRCLCYNCNCCLGRYGYCPHQNNFKAMNSNGDN